MFPHPGGGSRHLQPLCNYGNQDGLIRAQIRLGVVAVVGLRPGAVAAAAAVVVVEVTVTMAITIILRNHAGALCLQVEHEALFDLLWMNSKACMGSITLGVFQSLQLACISNTGLHVFSLVSRVTMFSPGLLFNHNILTASLWWCIHNPYRALLYSLPQLQGN